MTATFSFSSHSPSFGLLDSAATFFPWLEAAGIQAVTVNSEDAVKDFDVILIPGSDDLSALQRVQNLGRIYPKKPMILLLLGPDDEQETAAIELGAFEIWTAETKFAPALARLRNQLAMLRAAGNTGARKRVHSPFLRKKQRLLQTLLSVVERPDDFRSFVNDFFSGMQRLELGTAGRDEILESLNKSSQDWGLEFLYKKLKAEATVEEIKQADKDLRTFIKTHQKLLEPILLENLS